MKKFMKILIVVLIIVIIGEEGLNLVREKKEEKEKFGG